MSVSREELNLTVSKRNVSGKEINVYSFEIWSANGLKVEAGTNGFHGGDGGHGSVTFFSIKDLAGTCMECETFGDYGNGGFAVELAGDCELDTVTRALRYAAMILEEQQTSSYERIAESILAEESERYASNEKVYTLDEVADMAEFFLQCPYMGKDPRDRDCLAGSCHDCFKLWIESGMYKGWDYDVSPAVQISGFGGDFKKLRALDGIAKELKKYQESLDRKDITCPEGCMVDCYDVKLCPRSPYYTPDI